MCRYPRSFLTLDALYNARVLGPIRSQFSDRGLPTTKFETDELKSVLNRLYKGWAKTTVTKRV